MTKKLSNVLLFGLLTAVVAIASTLPVSAQEVGFSPCFGLENNVEEDSVPMCDLSVTKEVSVNGGAYVPADSADLAATAVVGDTVTWRITLNDESVGYLPYLDVVITDILPSGVSYESHTASVGTYDETSWTVPTATLVGEFDYSTNLPAVLTITTLAKLSGTWENNAALTSVLCDGPCEYGDANADNDQNSAFVVVTQPSTPQVLGSSTPQVLAATGNQAALYFVGVGLLTIALTIFLYSANDRKFKVD